MKKILWTGNLLLLCSIALADNGPKTAIDGTTVQKITFDGDKMTIKYNNGTADATFDFADVIISFSGSTSIKERISMARSAGLEGKKIYTVKGVYMGKSVARLQPGLYVIDGKKILIK
ncbi:MAG: hypothetical protein II404_08295 [Prevotella sp.]|nr:hypothetical protein [Prevotella sp.]